MKTFYVQNNIGRSKYVVSFHRENSFNKDGSNFFDVRIFKNKRGLKKFISELKHNGYIEV